MKFLINILASVASILTLESIVTSANVYGVQIQVPSNLGKGEDSEDVLIGTPFPYVGVSNPNVNSPYGMVVVPPLQHDMNSSEHEMFQLQTNDLLVSGWNDESYSFGKLAYKIRYSNNIVVR
jgi:hypothetical protein